MTTNSKRSSNLSYVLFIIAAFVGGIAIAWGVQQWRTDQQAASLEAATNAYGGDFVLEAPWGESPYCRITGVN